MSFQSSDWCIKQNTSQNEYTGVIVGVKDPHANNRAQVRIPFLHKGVPDEYLPWFRNGNIQGNVEGETEIKIPVLGSTVKVMFENDDFYTGTFYDGLKSQKGIDQAYMADGNIAGYGNFDGHKDQWGNWWKVGNNGTVTFKTNQGVLLEIVGTTVHLSGVTETTVDSSDKITMNTTDFEINTDNSFTVNTENIFEINSKNRTTINSINTYALNTINSTVTATTSATTNSATITDTATTINENGGLINLTAGKKVLVTRDNIYSGSKSINSGHKHGGVMGGSGNTGGVT